MVRRVVRVYLTTGGHGGWTVCVRGPFFCHLCHDSLGRVLLLVRVGVVGPVMVTYSTSMGLAVPGSGSAQGPAGGALVAEASVKPVSRTMWIAWS